MAADRVASRGTRERLMGESDNHGMHNPFFSSTGDKVTLTPMQCHSLAKSTVYSVNFAHLEKCAR